MASRGKDGDVFVEVGSWLGRSAAFMAVELSRRGKGVKFYCVDTWEGSDEEAHREYMKTHDIYTEFKANTRFCGDWIIPMRMKSVDAAQEFSDRSLSFVFLDGSHEFLDVKADIDAWLPKVKVGGILAGHDYNWPGVQSAVSAKFLMHGISGASWVVEVDRHHIRPRDFIVG